MANTTLNFAGLFATSLARPLFRSLITATAGTPKDNTNTPGTQYTFTGGEYVMLQGDAAFYFEVIDSASMTAGGGKAEMVPAGTVRGFFLKQNDTKIAIDPVSGTANVKVFEGSL